MHTYIHTYIHNIHAYIYTYINAPLVSSANVKVADMFTSVGLRRQEFFEKKSNIYVYSCVDFFQIFCKTDVFYIFLIIHSLPSLINTMSTLYIYCVTMFTFTRRFLVYWNIWDGTEYHESIM